MLRQLADIISGAIDNIDTNCNEMNVGYPDLDDPFNPVAPSEAASMAPENLHAAALVVAACAQLIATVNVPGFTLYNTIGGASILKHNPHVTYQINTSSFMFRPPCVLQLRAT